MKVLTILTFGFAAILVALHVEVFIRGFDPMPLFFGGVPFAIVTTVLSITALKLTKNKRFWIPLSLGLLPLIGWTLILGLELLF